MGYQTGRPREVTTRKRETGMGGTAVAQRVVQAAAAAIAEHGYASAIDVYVDIGWLAPADLDRWRQGRVQCLERVVHASLPQADVRAIAAIAVVGGTAPSGAERDRRGCPGIAASRPLRFSVGGAAGRRAGISHALRGRRNRPRPRAILARRSRCRDRCPSRTRKPRPSFRPAPT
ncbi:MAG: hypothetical protein WKF47_10945 [Geodermatophilaceae bacterium]